MHLKGLSLGFVCFLAFGSAAQAQDMEAFKTRMGQAAAATKVDLNEALRQYLEIRIEYAGPEVDYSLGRAYQRMNQCAQAQHYYTQVMVAYDLPDKNPVYQRAVNAFDEIAACAAWQKVTLECAIPVGGYVMIDGERHSECWNRPYSMSDGEHTFALIAKDGKKVEKKIKTTAGADPATVTLAFPEKLKSVEKVVEKEVAYIEKDKFNPALYWGLIAGGAAIVAVGGFMNGYAGQAKIQEQIYADAYAISTTDAAKEYYQKKRDDTHNKVVQRNTIMYSLIGAGSAVALTGAILAIVNAVSDKERVAVGDGGFQAFVAPSSDGVALGLGMAF